MQAELSSQFEKGGLKGHDVTYTRSGDLRYIGQGYELRVPFADGPIDDPILAEVFQAFETIHAREYGHVFEESPIEIVNIRLTGSRQMPKINLRPSETKPNTTLSALEERPCFFRVDNSLQTLDTPLYQRDHLTSEDRVSGPAIIVQKATTIAVPPGASVIAAASSDLQPVTAQRRRILRVLGVVRVPGLGSRARDHPLRAEAVLCL